MESHFKYPNLQSRILLGALARKQPIEPVKIPRSTERFLQWYEKRVLKMDTRETKIDRPIFLIGMPRSGTTMLQDIMCAHPQVTYITNTMNVYPTCFCAVETIRRKMKLDFEGDRYIGDSVSVTAGSPSDAIAFWGKWFKGDPYSLEYKALTKEDFSEADLQNMYETIKKVIWFSPEPKKRIFNKLLSPLPHIRLVNEFFPDAKFVYILRDGRMTANSMLKLYHREVERQTRIHGRKPEKVFVPYPRFPKLAEYARQHGVDNIRTTAHLWDDSVTFIDTIKDRLNHFYEIRYEDILVNPIEQLSKIFEFCELSPVRKDDAEFWKKIGEVGALRHTNKYEGFDIVEDICRENLRKHGYLE